MALFGQGDPRWLVVDREDGKNVNAWHWEQHDILANVKSHLQTMFDHSVGFEDDTIKCEFTGLDKCTGEAFANQRRGKRFCLYELCIRVKFKITIKKQSEEAEDRVGEGTAEIPEVEQSEPVYECKLKITSGKPTAEFQKIAREQVEPAFRKAIDRFLTELVDQATAASSTPAPPSSSIDAGPVPMKTTSTAPAPTPISKLPASSLPPTSTSSAASSSSSASAAPTTGFSSGTTNQTGSDYTGPVQTIEMKVLFRCSPKDLYDTLLDENRVRAFTQAPATIGRNVGDSFSLLGGTIEGTQEELIPNQKIVQKWRFSNWTKGHYSTLTLTFEQKPKDLCELQLRQTDVPELDCNGVSGIVQRTHQGWNMYFWHRIKMVFGYAP